ncbi:MAG: beta-ketoacyl synthase chain length factor [Candidatus Tectimicrobiota bacterium]
MTLLGRLTTVYIQSWTAWAPGLPDRASWEHWLRHDTPLTASQDAPACEHIPALLRRRCSQTARMVLEVAFRVCHETHTPPQQVHTIYCSRHGEIQTLRTLLDDLATASPLSPTAFGNAVHHTPTGYWGITAQNPCISRTLSSGEESFACGYLEASCLLRQDPRQPVILIVADELLPAPFATSPVSPPFPYAVALLLRADGCAGGVPLRFGQAPPGTPRSPVRYAEPVYDFLHWLVCAQDPAQCLTAMGGWQWQRCAIHP